MHPPADVSVGVGVDTLNLERNQRDPQRRSEWVPHQDRCEMPSKEPPAMSLPTFESVRLDIAGSTATITLARPHALNAITVEMLSEVAAALERADSDPSVRVIVLTGEGRSFSAGVDLKALGDRRLSGGKVGDVLDLPARSIIDLIRTTERIVVAKVNGHCFTGALEIALACDIVVAADEAVLGDTHTKWGLRPTWGMSQRLPWLAGAARARYLAYTARTFTGREAVEWGIAARSCPGSELDDVVAEIAAAICANSRGALAAYKDLYRASERMTLAEGLGYEADMNYPIDDTDERLARFR
jgi:enoyl-CoA hydratase